MPDVDTDQQGDDDEGQEEGYAFSFCGGEVHPGVPPAVLHRLVRARKERKESGENQEEGEGDTSGRRKALVSNRHKGLYIAEAKELFCKHLPSAKCVSLV